MCNIRVMVEVLVAPNAVVNALWIGVCCFVGSRLQAAPTNTTAILRPSVGSRLLLLPAPRVLEIGSDSILFSLVDICWTKPKLNAKLNAKLNI
ncbi:MAG: hypothetical protein Q7T42_10345 [Methylotenera sp.]|uniref:hypothetical protein n=2 Tax=Methylotenera sp. TaxID=2051956 RepID=UPI0027255035|nr:hypothetical protein [Methylotenera sp.]MDO9394358.1 hypothetical protein [Methylotenera sp.]